MSFTSANRASTAAAASSGTPRRRSAAASCACVRGAAVSIRRQICRAIASGSASGPASGFASHLRRRLAFGPGVRLAPRPAPAPSGSAAPVAWVGWGREPSRARRRPAIDALALLAAQVPHRSQPWRRRRGCAQASSRAGLGIDPGTNAELLLDLLLYAFGEVGVVAQEVPGVLLALAELVAVVGVPGARFAHDALLHT